MGIHLFLYLLFLLGRTSNSQCLNLCDCEQKSYVVNVACTGHDLDDIPQDLPCNVGILNLRENFIATLKRESFSCQSQLSALLLSNNHLRYIEKKVFDDATQLVYIELDSNFLQSIPYLGTLPTIQHISIIRNSLAEWHHDTLRNTSGTRLASIKLAFNKLYNLPKIPFRVHALDLRGNAINDLSTSMFTYPKAISNLYISYNNVEYLDKLQTMENLRILSLEFNQIRSISDTVFANLPFLETINLMGNNIVDASPFRNMLHIKSIILEDNHIQFVGRPAFTNIPNIDSIVLKGNRIIQFTCDSFFSTPLSLILFNNNIVTMDIFHGVNHSNLRVLNVDWNDLQSISILYFPALYSLYASNNNITNVEFGIHGHQNLEYINLNGNQIMNIKNFGNLPNLQWLSLNYNSLTRWHDKNLIRSSRLYCLCLINNRLSVLSNFTALPRLEFLDLSGNILHTIENSTFNSLPRLATLNLTQNKISCLSFLSSMTPLTELYISHNRIRAINPQVFSNLINLRTLQLAFNFIVEINTLGLHSLQHLDISHNLLTHLNVDHLFDQRTLVHINMEDNRITEVISTTALHISINNNAIGSSNSSLLSGSNILACNNNLKEFKQVRISLNLVTLSLNKNQIVSIPNYTFIVASSLRFLELDDNHIVHISHLAFLGLQSGLRLSLERNRLAHLPSGVFSYIQKLEYLRLGGNPLTQISNRPFSAIQGLLGVFFSCIPFSNMSIQVLQDIQMVAYIDLQENLAFQALFMSNMSTVSLLEFPNLRLLNLSSNKLGNHCPTFSMKTVETVDFSNNTFTSIPKYCLPQNSKAYNLFLSQNKITGVSKDSFDKRQQFWLLDLRYNHIVVFELGSLRHQTYLTNLYLEGNRLTKLDLGFLSFSLKFIVMNLQSNPWSCDCDLIKTVRELHPNNKPLVCEDPSFYANSTVAELAAFDNFTCRPQLCSQPHQTLLSFVGDTMVELPCPITTSNIIHWSVTFRGQQPSSISDALPDGVSILPHNALLITYVTKVMTGFYTCWSGNEAGQTKFTANLLVEEVVWNSEEERSNLPATLATNWKDTLLCGNKSVGNTIGKPYNVLFSLMLAAQSLFFITKYNFIF